MSTKVTNDTTKWPPVNDMFRQTGYPIHAMWTHPTPIWNSHQPTQHSALLTTGVHGPQGFVPHPNPKQEEPWLIRPCYTGLNVTEGDVNKGIMVGLLFQYPIEDKEYWTDLYILYWIWMWFVTSDSSI